MSNGGPRSPEAPLAPRRRPGAERRFSDEDLLDVIRRAAQARGSQVLGVREFREWASEQPGAESLPAVATIIRRFGTWRAALERCELRDARSAAPLRADNGPRDALISVARALSVSSLPRRQYDEYRLEHSAGLPHSETIRRRYGTWAAALEAAGLGAVRGGSGRRFDDDELLQALRSAAAAARPLSAGAYQRWREGQQDDLPAAQTIVHRFGGWSAALAAADLASAGSGPGAEELTEILVTMSRRLKTPRPSANTYRMYRSLSSKPLPALSAYYRVFGNWPNALRAAGLGRGWERLGPEQLAAVLKRVAAALGTSTLRASQYRKYRAANDPALPAPSTYYFRFGSWPAALAAAGLSIPS